MGLSNQGRLFLGECRINDLEESLPLLNEQYVRAFIRGKPSIGEYLSIAVLHYYLCKAMDHVGMCAEISSVVTDTTRLKNLFQLSPGSHAACI